MKRSQLYTLRKPNLELKINHHTITMKNESHKILFVTFYSFVSYKILIEVYINHKSNIVETLGYNFDVLENSCRGKSIIFILLTVFFHQQF